MNNKRYIVLIDIDDTIENLCEEWCNYLNEKHGCCINYYDVTDWDISKFFPQLTKEQVYEPLHTPEIWYKLKPKGESVKYIKRLIDDGYCVYLCTSTDYRNVRPKYEGVIQKHFPYIKWSQVIVASNKQMINADFLIDDGVHNLIGGKYRGILMDAPHNRSFDESEHGIIRAESWSEVYQLIKSMTKQDKF